MKRITLVTTLVIAANFFISCDHSNGTTATLNQTMTTGTWKVTLFTDSGNDETSDFNGYTFTFNNGGVVTAVKNGSATNGTWSVNSGSGKFNIDLGPKTDANKPLGELTDDWKIISQTDTEIRLTDDNVASNEFLTFSRI